ncbi:hypothetical protein CHS0354_031840 [Potamilus streckersoni]|uniref:Nucleotide exchange factor Fes1 domain-containing protein n=1 Tax=Potamilus streckersoni TaxID=2493646 RepID=A0AAE0VKQ4_9BIVA|nr:hypothetical protein CHS0354_031840 [Potamilus streckersoni]
MASSNPPRGDRVPKDLKGLLRFCAEATKNEDHTTESTFKRMPEEKRKWLDEFLNEMTVNPVERMKACLFTIVEGVDLDKKIAAFDELHDWCEYIDFAIDFHRIGGFCVLQYLLHQDEPVMRWKGLELIAALVQNNPYCQKVVLEEPNLFKEILLILDTDSDATVRTKALLATSCLTRDFPEAQKIFVDSDGFSIILRAMQSNVEKLKVKAAFMLSSFVTDKPEYKNILCDMGMIDQLIGHLGEEHSSFHEHLLSAILTIVQDFPRGIKEFRRPELDMEQILLQKQKDLAGKEESMEELHYAKELLKLIQENQSENQDVAR